LSALPPTEPHCDLLAIGAHPDDVELSCGGWLALAHHREQSVVIVDLSHGERATNGTPAERSAEAQWAAERLGVTVRTNLGLPDCEIDERSPQQLQALIAAIRQHRPALLLAPWTAARHPDHAAAGALAKRAAFLAGVANFHPELGDPWRPSRLIHYPQRQDATPDFVIDITAVIDQKRAAIACHASQFGAGPVATLINNPLGLGAFETRDRYWGASIGVEFGEPYFIGAPVPLSDPITHFKTHPAAPLWMPPR
jgi:bacillithiol biosynthesis deacetylase BshB1